MPLTPFSLILASVGFGLGVVAGSFLSTVALRWPAGRGVVRGRSACDGCGMALRAAELVPVLSWIVQRGACRRCGARIASLHPGMELAAGGIGAVALTAAPDAAGVAGAVFGWALLLLGVLDVRHHWLPDRVTLPLLGLGLAGAAVGAPAIEARLIGAAGGYAALEAVRRGYALARGRAGLGGGDPKLFAAIGAWLGWAALPGVLLGASVTGLGMASLLRLRGRDVGMASRFPFGALLAPAAFVGWLYAAGAMGGR